MKEIKYIVENERDLLWGLSITTVGCETIGKGMKYPTANHQQGYYFDPQKGRVLQDYQLVYIPEGSGTFRTQSVETTSVKAGTMFLLFPDEWHTYAPDVNVGWKQYWIGFKGTNIDNRVQQGFLRKKSPIFDVGVNDEIIHLYRKAIEAAEHEKAYFQQMLAGITNHLLGLMYSLDRNIQLNKNRFPSEKIDKARIIMREEMETALTIQDIALMRVFSYSTFRKQFKEYTGLSPAHYFQDLKLQRAKELLCTTSLSIKEIAYSLNFESPDYFSTLFKKRMGKKPSDFRE